MDAFLSQVSKLNVFDPGRGFCYNAVIASAILYFLTYLDPSYRKGGRLWPAIQRLSVWNKIADYFDASIDLEEPLDHKQQYIFCCFPHGTCTISHLITMTDCRGMLSKHYSGPRRDLAASVLFYIPILKDILLWLGNVDASPKTATFNLKRGRSLYIYIGGEKEQLLTEYGDSKVYTRKDRPGYVRLALQYGIPLVPMYAFGETKTHYTSKLFFKFRLWLQEATKIAIPIFWGRGFSILPLETKIGVEVGKPIQVPKVEDPGKVPQALIDEYHAKFELELERLFERTKGKYGLKESDKLEFIR